MKVLRTFMAGNQAIVVMIRQMGYERQQNRRVFIQMLRNVE